MGKKKVRHILGLSGGKDSAALAVYLRDKVPEMEYFFCDTGKELPETYEFLERMKARLGIKIELLSSKRDFDHWLNVYGGVLPSPQVRWCTRQLKILPLEDWVKDDEVISYVAIRADEDREGHISKKQNIKTVFPFKEDGLNKEDIIRILDDSGIGMPDYYRWRSRSGCYFCFFQRKYEWVRLSEEHPEFFQQSIGYENAHKDGRQYFWNEKEPLSKLVERKEKIITNHQKAMAQEKKSKPNKPLADVFSDVLDSENDDEPCLICTL